MSPASCIFVGRLLFSGIMGMLRRKLALDVFSGESGLADSVL